MAKKKFYVVWKGNEPGIYEDWKTCQLQIKGFPDAKYKSFKTRQEAEDAYYGTYHDFIQKKEKAPKKINPHSEDIIKDSISVDAACSGNPGDMEYRGVHTIDRTEIFHQGPFKKGTNNIGEFLAIVHALALMEKAGNERTTIYTDSKTAISWVNKQKVKTTLVRDRHNEILFQLVDRAIIWLKTHEHRNPILKWDTKNWGEIPADFGRK